MFKNLFKKEAIIADLPKSISKAIYPKEVMEIHHEFETAADRLFDEAQIIIKEAEGKDIQKVSRLEKLGFTSSSQVTNIKPLLKKAELSKEQIELISYYKKNYPNNKFITEDQVKEICHKYNLVFGNVDKFTGFIPEKNLREIEAFQLKKEDIPFASFLGDSGNIYYLKKSDFTNFGLRYCIKEKNDFYIGLNYDYPMIYNSNKFPNERVSLINNKNILKICAPIKDMNTKGMRITDGYKLEKHIPDPVVLQPVKGGFLILTAWGDEAEDPIVKND